VTPASTELLSIFFPMWNEEDYVERAVSAATSICVQMVGDGVIGDYELIIVDDKSTDRTPEIADALADKDSHVRVIHHPVNRKLGGSIKTGFETATGDLVLYSDADLPFDFEEVPRAIRLLRLYDADLVSAYRFDRFVDG
jgi:glycosyltransferase involved in cell wall biosynthesis